MAEVIIKKLSLTFFNLIFFFSFTHNAKSLEIIRDIELENFTKEIISILSGVEGESQEKINIYFIKSNEVNAFVTGGQNIFINTELIIKAEDYREYAAVLAHEIAHIQGGHIFNTSLEINNLSNKAFPIYLLGIVGIITGASEAGMAGVMVGQASVADSFTSYSRTQEASADQAAVKLMCENGIDATFLITFLDKMENFDFRNISKTQNYRSTHPLIENRKNWISNTIDYSVRCDHPNNQLLGDRFELVKAKIHGFTHPYDETKAIYNSNTDKDLYATAVANYFQGEHGKSVSNLKKLIRRNPKNPYYKELLGEIFYANNNYEKATLLQKQAIMEIEEANDLYFMILGNYLLSYENFEKSKESINFLRKSIRINKNNAHSWYLLARAYADIGEIPLANYATAERYFLIGEKKLSYDFASKALKNIEENTPEWYRSYDLIEMLKKNILLEIE